MKIKFILIFCLAVSMSSVSNATGAGSILYSIGAMQQAQEASQLQQLQIQQMQLRNQQLQMQNELMRKQIEQLQKAREQQQEQQSQQTTQNELAAAAPKKNCFDTEQEAQKSCSGGDVEWFDLKTKILYVKGNAMYGNTATGAYVCYGYDFNYSCDK